MLQGGEAARRAATDFSTEALGKFSALLIVASQMAEAAERVILT